MSVKHNRMSRAVKCSLAIGIGILGNIAASILWESSAFANVRTDNPVNTILHWCSVQTTISRGALVSLVVWLLVSLVVNVVLGLRPQNKNSLEEAIRKSILENK